MRSNPRPPYLTYLAVKEKQRRRRNAPKFEISDPERRSTVQQEKKKITIPPCDFCSSHAWPRVTPTQLDPNAAKWPSPQPGPMPLGPCPEQSRHGDDPDSSMYRPQKAYGRSPGGWDFTIARERGVVRRGRKEKKNLEMEIREILGAIHGALEPCSATPHTQVACRTAPWGICLASAAAAAALRM
jgi:hypothetical protein